MHRVNLYLQKHGKHGINPIVTVVAVPCSCVCVPRTCTLPLDEAQPRTDAASVKASSAKVVRKTLTAATLAPYKMVQTLGNSPSLTVGTGGEHGKRVSFGSVSGPNLLPSG